MKKYIITEEQVNAFLKYIEQRPLKEVLVGYEILKNLPELKDKE